MQAAGPLRIVVTGASGFLGAVMTGYFLAHGHEVQALVRPGADLWRPKSLDFTAQACDYTLTSLRATLRDFHPHAIVNAAAPGGHITDMEHYQEAMQQSQYLLGNLLQAAAELEVPPVFVHLCSSMVYAHQESALRESGPMTPINLRGLLKLHERNLCRYFAKQHKLPVRLLRVFRAYGPLDHPDRLIPVLCRQLASGEPIKLAPDSIKRDYVFTDDLSEMALRLIRLESEEVFVEVNGGSGQEYCARDIVEALAAIAERVPVYSEQAFTASPADRRVSRADMQHAQGLIGWNEPTPLQAGLRACWQAFLNQSH